MSNPGLQSLDALGGRPRPRARPGRRLRYSWETLSDNQLLSLRFCDLGLRWLSQEWFSPDGIPGIAIPFYLAHPRLVRIERRLMREVEGGNRNWLMRILRHEAGHAIDTAYRVRRRRGWREVFGPASLPYPDTYRPRPGSRRFVQHLGAWYAQAHPTEDFAETFAVWLKPKSAWRREYRGWHAYAKLEYIDELAAEIGEDKPLIVDRTRIEDIAEESATLRQHYERKLARYRMPRRSGADELLLKVFTADRRRGACSGSCAIRCGSKSSAPARSANIWCTRCCA
jgi:hypothetical protein